MMYVHVTALDMTLAVEVVQEHQEKLEVSKKSIVCGLQIVSYELPQIPLIWNSGSESGRIDITYVYNTLSMDRYTESFLKG